MLSNYPLEKFGENDLVLFPQISINQVSLKLKDSGFGDQLSQTFPFIFCLFVQKQTNNSLMRIVGFAAI